MFLVNVKPKFASLLVHHFISFIFLMLQKCFHGLDHNYGNVELLKTKGTTVRYTCLKAAADTKMINQACKPTVGSELIHEIGHSTY